MLNTLFQPTTTRHCVTDASENDHTQLGQKKKDKQNCRNALTTTQTPCMVSIGKTMRNSLDVEQQTDAMGGIEWGGQPAAWPLEI